MSMKRSRISESSNFIEKDLLNHMSLTAESARASAGTPSGERKPPKCLKPSVDESNKEQIRHNMFLRSPACARKYDGLGDFLKYCNFCGEKIKENEDVFMYRDYCAYCSEKCRDYQIELDEILENEFAEAVQEQDANNLKNGSY